MTKKKTKANANSNSKVVALVKLPKPKTQSLAIKVTGVPVAQGSSYRRPQPKISSSGNGDVSVTHMEYIRDVQLQEAYNVTTDNINPQAPGTFPWLFALATRFEMYKFEKLCLHYRPSCSTTTPGYVIMSADFDFYDAAPSKTAMLNWQMTRKCAAWEAMDLDITQHARLQIDRYCDVSATAGRDKRLDSLGNFFVATEANALASPLVIGELYVSYSIKLKIPSLIIPNALSGKIDYTSPTTNTDYFGTSAANFRSYIIDKTNLALDWIQSNIISISTPGRYIINLQLGGAGLTIPTLNVVENPGAPGSNWTSSVLSNTTDGVGAMTLAYALTLLNGKVDLGLTSMTAVPTRVITRIGTFNFQA